MENILFQELGFRWSWTHIWWQDIPSNRSEMSIGTLSSFTISIRRANRMISYTWRSLQIWTRWITTALKIHITLRIAKKMISARAFWWVSHSIRFSRRRQTTSSTSTNTKKQISKTVISRPTFSWTAQTSWSSNLSFIIISSRCQPKGPAWPISVQI